MVFHFLDAKKLNVQSGEMEERTWKEYETYGDRMIRVFGAKTTIESLGPADFKQLRADFQKTHKSLASLKGVSAAAGGGTTVAARSEPAMELLGGSAGAW